MAASPGLPSAALAMASPAYDNRALLSAFSFFLHTRPLPSAGHNTVLEVSWVRALIPDDQSADGGHEESGCACACFAHMY